MAGHPRPRSSGPDADGVPRGGAERVGADAPAEGATEVDEDAVDRLRMALLRLSRRLRQESPPGITPSQLSALASIAHLGPVTIGDLATHENVQPPSISRIVGALEGEGWVERIADPADRRVALVQLTPGAARELRRIRQERNAYLARRLATLAGDERAAVLAALPALERMLQEEDR
jgi:DNA-binding MarR family transcriptional regulator